MINDLAEMWRSAGLPFPPSRSALLGAAATSPSFEVFGGSPLGSNLWTATAATPDPLGYNPLTVSSEVVVGDPPGQLSEVTGTIGASRVRAALGRDGLHGEAADGYQQYLVPLKVGSPDATALAAVGRIIVPAAGGRLVAGGPATPGTDVAGLLSGRTVSDPLASDPAVSRMMALLRGSQVMAMGTSLVTPLTHVLGSRAAPDQLHAFAIRYGLDRLPAAPSFAGFGYLPGKPLRGTAMVAAIYPNSSDARAAIPIMRTLLDKAISPFTNSPYAKIWSVKGLSVNGDAVVTRLTMLQAGALSQAATRGDVPLFWSPLHAAA